MVDLKMQYGEIQFVDLKVLQRSKTSIQIFGFSHTHGRPTPTHTLSAHIYQIIKGDVRSDGALLKKHAMKFVVLLPTAGLLSIDETTDKNNLINRSMARIDTKTNTNATKTKTAGVNMTFSKFGATIKG